MAKKRSPRDWREARRLRGRELVLGGRSQSEVAEILGVTRGAVSQWMKAARDGGEEALRYKPASGRPPDLDDTDVRVLVAALQAGAELFGFRGDVWTRARVAQLIHFLFDRRYHPAHAGRILKRAGWTPQKPIRRARQRDEAAI